MLSGTGGRRVAGGAARAADYRAAMDVAPVVAVLGTLVVAWALLLALLWAFRPRDTRLADLVRVVPDVLRLVRGLLRDGSVPLGARGALVGLLAWLVSPIDLVPEFLPVIGPLDDVVVAILVLRYVRGRVGEAELRRRWRGSDEGFALLTRLLGR